MMDRHDADDALQPSRSARKREADDLRQLGQTLTALTSSQLQRMPVSADLREAIREFNRIESHNARRRQLQLIGKLMRQESTEEIREALDQFDQKSAVSIAAHHQAERWRERLLQEGQAALTEFLTQQPTIDRQHLRHMIRAAQKERASGASGRHSRELFRLIRDVVLNHSAD